jgi:hypothetical protein
MTDQTSTIPEDVPSVDIEARDDAFIPSSEVPEDIPMDEDDPRAAIYKKHDQRRAEELGVEPPAAEEKVIAATPEKEEEITVKVNGKEQKVPKSKIEEAGGVKAYQKAKAADEMLRQASEELRKAREVEAQAQSKLEAIRQQEKNLQDRVKSPTVLPDGALKDMARKYHEAILDGDMDAADELLVGLQRAQTATLNEDAIAKRAAQAARAEMVREQMEEKQRAFEKERIEASNSFADDYPDIAEDQDLFKITNAKTLEIYQENPNLGPKAIFKKAVDDVRELMARQSGKQSTTSDKLDAKRSQTTIRSGSVRSATKPAEKPISNSQYVEMLRQRRGLGV